MHPASTRFEGSVDVCLQWITLVVHPGPPGDAGPSSLDWALLGDDGSQLDSSTALSNLLSSSSTSQRSHWGTIVFQANEHLDGGSVWAWEQYPLPDVTSSTKAQLYQGLHSQRAILSLITAMMRVYSTVEHSPRSSWMTVQPKPEWQRNSITDNLPFLGGTTRERPLLQSKQRKPDFKLHTAKDILRILNASDSQPGAQLSPLSDASKTNLFAYGAHIHLDISTIPSNLYQTLGYQSYSAVPNGKIIATRSGAMFMKTRSSSIVGDGVGIWITHGRIPKKLGSPLEPKIPMVEAIRSSGHGRVLERVLEWEQGGYEEVPGSWQEVWVKRVKAGDGVAMCVYWEF